MAGETIRNNSEQSHVVDARTIGAKVLAQNNFEKRHEEIVNSSYEKSLKSNEKIIGSSPSIRKNYAYISRLENIINRYGNNLEKKLWEASSKNLLVQAADIPESYWKTQEQLLRDNGTPMEIDENDKDYLVDQLQKQQKESLDYWSNYLSDKNCPYPMWFKLYAWDGMSKMGVFDKSKGEYAKRDKSSVAPYPHLNQGILGKVYDVIATHYGIDTEKDLSNEDSTLEQNSVLETLIQNGSFNKLYSYFLIHTKNILETPEKTEDIHGEWVEYGLGDEEAIARAADGTPWCVASPAVGRHYLTYGTYGDDDEEYDEYDDNYNDKDNKAKFIFFHLIDEETGQLADSACASIRLDPDGNVAEISGLNDGQALEDALVPIVEEKVKTLPGGESFLQAFADKKKLIDIDHRIQAGKTDFSEEDFNFIFNHEITTLDTYNNQDPRIAEARIFLLSNIVSPEGLHVEGDLDLTRTNISKLPEGLHVGGSLDLRRTNISELPEGLHVGGNLLTGTNISKLPEGLYVGGSLDLYGTNISELSEGLHVGRRLSLNGTNISELPEGLHVGGDLDLSETNISKLPEGLHVGGNLYLRETNISELPERLYVGGYLDLSDTNISEFPEGLHVGEDLDLIETNISELPEGLHVGRGLDLYGTNISELPEGLHVGGDLDLGRTNISKLPEGLYVGGSLNLIGTNISELPKGLYVGENLFLCGTNISELSEGLYVGGSLDLSETNISELPEGVHVGGEIMKEKTIKIS